MTRAGKRDIDDVVLNLWLKDKTGDTLSANAITDATPGVVWLKAGASIVNGVPLDHRKAAETLLRTHPADGNLVVEVKSMTFMGK